MGARILIVEDNPANLKLMSYLLKAFGHTVVVAWDGEEALQVVQKESLDLIICDVQLPKKDGYEVARTLKAHPALRKIPLVAVTALAMVGDRDKVLAAGFDGYIAKPIVPQTFVKQVEAFLPTVHNWSEQPTAPASNDVSPPTEKRATVLAVDNTPANIQLARKTLEPFGYQVLAAGSVTEALATARRTPPDLILSDLHMPHQNGFDLIRAVKLDPNLRAIPFLFISSTYWQKRDKAEGFALGAAKFLERPMTPQALLAEIEECLQVRKRTNHAQDPDR